MKKIITGLLLAVISFPLKAGDDFCGVKNFAFKGKEIIANNKPVIIFFITYS